MSLKLQGLLYGRGEPIAMQVRDGIVERLEEDAVTGASLNRWLVPGFFDLQVNGFAGVDFCNPALTVADVERAARAILATGTTRFLPTIITGALDDMCRELFIISTAIETSPLVRQMCPGIHVEGPFIHPEDGPRGAHPREHVRPPSVADFDRLYEAAKGMIRILTIAADQPGAPDLIAHATRKGVLVAIGHHRVNGEQLEAAIVAGARMCTHLGNGSDATLPRLDNPIWRQLGEDRLWASFIADGHHLPPPVLKGMLRAKRIAYSILVTDAMSAAGMPPGQYRIGPVLAERTSTGKVVLPGTPYLAGSAADMPLCISRAVVDGGLRLEEAIRLASRNPAHLLLGEPLEWVPEIGDSANLVELEWDVGRGSPQVLQAVHGLFHHNQTASGG